MNSKRMFIGHPVQFSKLVLNWIIPTLSAVSLVCASTTSWGIDWEKRDRELAEHIKPILEKACNDCHSGAEADAGLALTHFQTAKSILKERHTWTKVIQRIEIGDMPPPDAEQLTDEEKKNLIGWIQSMINDIECGLTPNPGSVTLRRLNRVEYQNSVRDVLGINYTPAKGFPGDDVGYGFDNIGDVLTLPPLLMEKYIKAAEEISETVIQAPKPGDQYDARIKIKDVPLEGGANESGGHINFYSNGKANISEKLPWRGNFLLRVEASGTPSAGVDPQLKISLNNKELKTLSVASKSFDDVIQLEIPFRSPNNKPVQLTLEFPNDHYVKATGDKKAEDRNLRVLSVSIFGQKPPVPVPEIDLKEPHKKIVRTKPGLGKSVRKAAEECLGPVASRLFRRPVKSEELSRIAKLTELTVEAGDSFEAGLQLGLQAMLVSPHFLFKVESPETKKGDQYPLLSDYELATRLSYFLWSSTPDHELLVAATKGRLRDPNVLRQQIRRMIAHPRATNFVQNFAGQWLNLRKLDVFEPNANLFPRWNEEVRELARLETFHFVRHVLLENLSILRMLDAEYTFLNEKLAYFYSIPGVTGTKFQQVSTSTFNRKGLLTHASVLAVTSNPTRTSPVKRGKWILDNLLGTPPPPAPPGVPELEKAALSGTMREQMEQHRADPACAGCHKLMDPLGLALENFDAVGRWRATENGQQIDTSGELPSGEKVRGAEDLIRNLSTTNNQQFARCFAEKLMTYAIGRGLEYYDRCAVDKILVAAAKDDYKFQTLIELVVLSDPFQRKGVRDEL